MTNLELNQKMSELVKSERRITNEILAMINLADSRRLHLELGFSSLFDWLVRGHGYSESAAQRRIQAARLMKAVPDVVDKLESGQTNLSNLAKVQSTIWAQEKLSGKKLSAKVKAEVIERIESKSHWETKKTLLALFPESVAQIHGERRTAICDNFSRLSLNFDEETLKDLEKIKDILSHTLPIAGFAEVIRYIAKEFLRRKQPQIENKPVIADSAKHRVTQNIPIHVRRTVFKRDQKRCTYKDPNTGRVCGSTFQIQIDHIHPRALGGGNEIANLRCLCGAHNRMLAEKIFG